jgi:hypothetical protein
LLCHHRPFSALQWARLCLSKKGRNELVLFSDIFPLKIKNKTKQKIGAWVQLYYLI